MAIKRKSESSKIVHRSSSASKSKGGIRGSSSVGVDTTKCWPPPIIVSCDPTPYTLPEELIKFQPTENETHKFFFKNTPNEVVLRQIFLHQPLHDDEQLWLKNFREYCKEKNYDIPHKMEPMLLRVLWYNKRKFGEAAYFEKSLAHIQDMYAWRLDYFSLSDTSPDLLEDLNRGIMYWVGRDAALRPLLTVRLNRAPKNMPSERFETLTIFCFEWALRYLMLPGKAETCTVLVDVRGVPLLQIPASALKNMITILTKQYPFRLNKMWIVHDMTFMQALWNIAKPFLTEVQQAKIAIYRNNVEGDLAKEYPLNQLEKKYGGLRPEITSFYPFPLAPGPYVAGSSEESNMNAYKNAWKACDSKTATGIMWEGDCRAPIQWAEGAYDVFKDLGLDPPIPDPRKKHEEEHEKDSAKREEISLVEHIKTTSMTVSSNTHYSKTEEGEGNIYSNNASTLTPFPEHTTSSTTKSFHDDETHTNLPPPQACAFTGPSSSALSPPTEKAAEDTPSSHEQSKMAVDENALNVEDEAAVVIATGGEKEEKERKEEEKREKEKEGKGGKNVSPTSDANTQFAEKDDSAQNKDEEASGKDSGEATRGGGEECAGGGGHMNDATSGKKGPKVRSKQCCNACVVQ